MAGLLDTRYTHGYETPQDAAAAVEYALRDQPNYTNQEYAAVITRGPDGKYYHSGFDRAENSGDAKSSAPISSLLNDIPDGHTAVATVHNHPNRKDGVNTSWLSQADVNIGQGYGSKKGMWQEIDKSVPVTSRGKPTGPLQPFLVSGNKDLGEPTGELKTLYSDLPNYKQYNVGLTSQALAGIPIDEMKIQWAKKIMQNQLMPVEMKQKILANLVPGYTGPGMASQ